MTKKSRRKPFARLQWRQRHEELPEAALLSLDTLVPPSSAEAQKTPGGMLIQGENLKVMASLLGDYRERIHLIYADPPFLTGKAYAARIGRGEDSRRPQEWRTTHGYPDAWPDGAAYLDMLFPRLQLMYDLLAPTGTLYLHLDWHASAYARVLLDEIFGPDRLLNEIVWVYHGPSPIRSAFKRKHDTILVYTKSNSYTFNADAVRIPYADSTVRTFESSPKAGFGKQPDLEKGKVPEDWWYFPVVARLHSERTGYPTQKPEALLERILLASSNPGELVADFFSGSGTTPVVAEQLKRRWIACDNAPLAVLSTYRRLLLTQRWQSFGLWHAEHAQAAPDARLEAVIHQEGPRVEIQLKDLAITDHDLDPFPSNVVLWEVDWSYDARHFQSRSQIVRPWRQEHIDLHLSHVYLEAGTHSICVRAVDALGGYASSTHEINVSSP